MLDALIPGELFEDLLHKAEQGYSHIEDPAVFAVEGFAFRATRCVINMLCRVAEPVHYVEVGSFRGATLAAAMSGNRGKFVGIDNFQEFAGNGFTYTDVNGNVLKGAEKLSNEASVKQVIASFGPINGQLIKADFRTLDMRQFANVDVFLYDAAHSAEETEMGITQFAQVLSPNAIVLVDDVDRAPVIAGVLGGFLAAGIKLARIFIMRGEAWNEGLLIAQRYA